MCDHDHRKVNLSFWNGSEFILGFEPSQLYFDIKQKFRFNKNQNLHKKLKKIKAFPKKLLLFDIIGFETNFSFQF